MNWNSPPAPIEFTTRGLPPDSHGTTALRNLCASGRAAALAGWDIAIPPPIVAANTGATSK
ncbi:hypothetical protein FrEUN1fDRAFT_2942, partial [Parafrankia sp. EUN1f]